MISGMCICSGRLSGQMKMSAMSDGRSISARCSSDGDTSLCPQTVVLTGPGLTEVTRMPELRYSSIRAPIRARAPYGEDLIETVGRAFGRILHVHAPDACSELSPRVDARLAVAVRVQGFPEDPEWVARAAGVQIDNAVGR